MKHTVTIDARGLNCPQPVLLTKKTLENSDSDVFLVLVDNFVSMENVCRFLKSQGLEPKVLGEKDGQYEIQAHRSALQNARDMSAAGPVTVSESSEESGLVIFVGSCFMGAGDNDLGVKLMRGFLRTLIDMSFTPWRMIFINSGVKLTSIDDEATEALGMLSEKGVEILSCGTCLQHYKVEDKLAVGRSTTMYEVIETLAKATKVISPD